MAIPGVQMPRNFRGKEEATLPRVDGLLGWDRESMPEVIPTLQLPGG